MEVNWKYRESVFRFEKSKMLKLCLKKALREKKKHIIVIFQGFKVSEKCTNKQPLAKYNLICKKISGN